MSRKERNYGRELGIVRGMKKQYSNSRTRSTVA